MIVLILAFYNKAAYRKIHPVLWSTKGQKCVFFYFLTAQLAQKKKPIFLLNGELIHEPRGTIEQTFKLQMTVVQLKAHGDVLRRRGWTLSCRERRTNCVATKPEGTKRLFSPAHFNVFIPRSLTLTLLLSRENFKSSFKAGDQGPGSFCKWSHSNKIRFS